MPHWLSQPSWQQFVFDVEDTVIPNHRVAVKLLSSRLPNAIDHDGLPIEIVGSTYLQGELAWALEIPSLIQPALTKPDAKFLDLLSQL
jgi:hypothetical protein